MKRKFYKVALCCFVLLCGALAACGGGTVNTESVSGSAQSTSGTEVKVDIEITEKYYVTYVNELYTNPMDYLGQTIQIEGMYKKEYWPSTGNIYNYVYRVGPGCCGTDGNMCGFEFSMDGFTPNDNDWIRVTGALYMYEENGANFLALRATNVEVLNERGLENVFE